MLNEQNNLLIYKNNDGNIIVDAIYKDETLWLTQKGMAKVVVEDSSVTASDGKKYKPKIYNLDAITAGGYRIHSKKATEFRIWPQTY